MHGVNWEGYWFVCIYDGFKSLINTAVLKNNFFHTLTFFLAKYGLCGAKQCHDKGFPSLCSNFTLWLNNYCIFQLNFYNSWNFLMKMRFLKSSFMSKHFVHVYIKLTRAGFFLKDRLDFFRSDLIKYHNQLTGR